MKKFSLIFVAVAFFTLDLHADNIKIFRKGSADGIRYDRITERHNIFSHSLSCLNPGSTICGWTSPPKLAGVSVDELTDFVLKEVANGKHSGSTRYNNLVLITWRYNSGLDELSIDMTDEI